MKEFRFPDLFKKDSPVVIIRCSIKVQSSFTSSKLFICSCNMLTRREADPVVFTSKPLGEDGEIISHDELAKEEAIASWYNYNRHMGYKTLEQIGVFTPDEKNPDENKNQWYTEEGFRESLMDTGIMPVNRGQSLFHILVHNLP